MCYSRSAVYAYVPNFVSIGLFSRSLAAKNPIFCQFLRFFGLRHLVLSPNGNSLTKLNTGAQLQTLPLSNGIKIVSVLQRLHSEIWRTVSDVQKRDEQTGRQTKYSTFWPPWRRVKSEPHQTWRGDRGPRAPSCTSKTFGGLMHSFAAKGR